ncbi:MAG: ATP-binding cassette domain-containing protein [Streptosporangiales bacterium]|nr:ATP-binding cassette domain-containing protein [Streptosporangiales bacterium]
MVFPAPDGAELRALADVSLDLPPGAFCGLVGPSGCGKSTFLMLIAGLYRPTTGRITIDEEQVVRPWDALGVVFQRDALLEWRTVWDNVLLPIEVKRLDKKKYRDRATRLLELVGLTGFEGFYPGELSGGMRQRVAICRSLIHEPRLLLMDEPFAAVDALTREKLNFDLLRLTAESQTGRGTTVVFVTHSIEEAVLLSDQILVMSPRPGKILRLIGNDLPKPRTLATRSEPRFHALVDDIRSAFHSMGLV